MVSAMKMEAIIIIFFKISICNLLGNGNMLYLDMGGGCPGVYKFKKKITELYTSDLYISPYVSYTKI